MPVLINRGGAQFKLLPLVPGESMQDVCARAANKIGIATVPYLVHRSLFILLDVKAPNWGIEHFTLLTSFTHLTSPVHSSVSALS